MFLGAEWASCPGTRVAALQSAGPAFDAMKVSRYCFLCTSALLREEFSRSYSHAVHLLLRYSVTLIVCVSALRQVAWGRLRFERAFVSVLEWSCVCESVESWINFRQCIREGGVVLWLSRESSLRRAGHVTSHVLLLQLRCYYFEDQRAFAEVRTWVRREDSKFAGLSLARGFDNPIGPPRWPIGYFIPFSP